jgi:hypothetical protein
MFFERGSRPSLRGFPGGLLNALLCYKIRQPIIPVKLTGDSTGAVDIGNIYGRIQVV